MKHIIWLFFLFCGLISNAQEFDTKIQGRISSEKGDVAATHISNISKNRGTIADDKGYFGISVRLNDTLVFSAVQFKRKEVVVTVEVIESKLLQVFLEPSLTELDEVVLMPYNLTGKLNTDTENLNLDNLISARTENLPNADFIVLTQSERKLYAARTWNLQIGFGIKVDSDPIFNYFSGRTKMLNERVARDEEMQLHEEFRSYYEDEWYVSALKIPKSEINNFIYFCELDTTFVSKVKTNNQLQLINLMKIKSDVFRKQNKLDE